MGLTLIGFTDEAFFKRLGEEFFNSNCGGNCPQINSCNKIMDLSRTEDIDVVNVYYDKVCRGYSGACKLNNSEKTNN